MDASEVVFSKVLQCLFSSVISEGDEGLDGLMVRYQQAAHLLIEYYLDEGAAARAKRAYDAGVTGGAYGADSAVSVGLLGASRDVDQVTEDSRLTRTLYQIARGHGELLNRMCRYY